MPYWDDLEWNDADEIDGPQDVKIPATAHHMQAKAELDMLVRAGALDEEQASRALKMWRVSSDVDGDDRVRGAVSILLDEGVVDESEADELIGRAPA